MTASAPSPHAPALTRPERDRGPIGLYVHVPFCTTKCGYCDFYSVPTVPGLIDPLARAVCAELECRNPGRSIETVFIGGGTPTVLPGPALAAILDAAAATAARDGIVPAGVEFTVEANPSSADEMKLDLLRRSGVNRVSFGAQSFHADELAVLERLHDPAQIAAAVRAARAAGFDNANLDLIFGVPGQTPARWRDSLRRAVDLAPEHLACYGLTYEPGTALTRRLHAGRVAPVENDVEAEMYGIAIDELAAAGYEHYEISNFARPGRRCRANVIYWENREYLGVGPSAVSYLDGERRRNVPDVRRYVAGVPGDGAGLAESIAVESERLDPRDRAAETAVQMLRLIDGIDLAAFRRRTGFDARDLFVDAVARGVGQGLLLADDKSIRLTRRGLLLANRVMCDFIPDRPMADRTVMIQTTS